MSNNYYDNSTFFEKYSNMERSVKGLEGSGEWHEFKKLLPSFIDKDILDLGCGFGWHCRYTMDNGANSAVGIDLSKKMIEKAKSHKGYENIIYLNQSIENFNFEKDSFDLVISSLTFHYIEDLNTLFNKVSNVLKYDEYFIFSIEHPIFTAYGSQDWIYDKNNNPLYCPVDNYFYDGKRNSIFLGENIIKYHHSLTSLIKSLISNNFSIVDIVEPMPSEEMLKSNPDMLIELRRPMMLLIKAQNKKSL